MSAASSTLVRESAIAGAWYPGSAAALRRTIEEHLNRVTPVLLPGPLLALVSPHAGYAYSGPTAAHAYAQARGRAFDRVVLLGPLHRPIWGSRLGALMVPTENAYRTPLGDVPLDRAFLAALGERVALTPVRGDQEHSLEIQLPFLQAALAQPAASHQPGFSLAPIMFGEQISEPGALARLDRVASALAALADEKTLVVASTDLSHMDDYADVVRTDRRLVDLVAAFDVDGLAAALAAEQVQACGAAGLVVALRAAQKRGARSAQALAYAASGDVTGDKRPGTYCVGYLAAAVYG
jgi:AmmeMemoRadiSam system protein B